MDKTYHELAPAKINLSLKVVGRRPTDNYHLLEMVNSRVTLFDELKVVFKETGESTLFIKGDFASNADIKEVSNFQKNIIGKACRLFSEKFNLSFITDIILEKNIPSGAGLGGGSSDAAAILKILAKKFLNIESKFFVNKTLLDIAVQCGADVPFFLYENKFSYVTGIGENVFVIKENHPAYNLSDKKIALIIPPFQISTTDVFKKFVSDKIKFSNKQNVNDWQLGYNDLLESSFKVQPKLKEYLDSLIKKVGQEFFMSGSGSSLFGINLSDSKLNLAADFAKDHQSRFYILDFL
jgi:4-diphosphocytidyl-2-C-methyl-D-erythritol kinase